MELTTTFSSTYHDFRKSDFPNVHNTLMDLFSKQIGILLKHKLPNRQKGIEIKVCTKSSHSERYQLHLVSPIYPNVQLPELLKLFNREECQELDDVRFKLLKWMISDEMLESQDLTAFSKDFFLDVMVLVFMRSKGFLSVNEADLILTTLIMVENNKIPAEYRKVDVVNERAFRISFLFTKLHVTLRTSLEVTGLEPSLTVGEDRI